MATLENMSERVFNVSQNIVMSIDKNNVGDLYVYGSRNRYVLNGASASDLIDYFWCNNKEELAEEILDFVMSVTVNTATN